MDKFIRKCKSIEELVKRIEKNFSGLENRPEGKHPFPDSTKNLAKKYLSELDIYDSFIKGLDHLDKKMGGYSVQDLNNQLLPILSYTVRNAVEYFTKDNMEAAALIPDGTAGRFDEFWERLESVKTAYGASDVSKYLRDNWKAYLSTRKHLETSKRLFENISD
jgi:hypothetical protein